ncbi:uncharacterized protein LOC113238613 [Hyposmocoma kahamanoa]|uniref:uncharacterized protein LOC113238613 n=1 Tax=Hyposmocoma kahamanoa TaxID=1477025 RepID=UPI000E6D94A9|nr:uncharacterized protein LOC113238613 [Hyposmocoma kahamanoa]
MKTFRLELTLITIVLIQRCYLKILRNNALMNKMVSHFQKDNPHNNLGLNSKRANRERPTIIEMDERTWPRGRNPVEIDERTDVRIESQPEPLDSQKHSKEPSRSDFSQPAPHPQASSPQKRERILSLMKNVLCKNFPAIPCNMIMQDEALNKLIQKSIQQMIYKQFQTSDGSTVSPHSPTVFPLINSEDLSNFLEVSNTGYFNAKKKQEDEKRQTNSIKMQKHWSLDKNSKKKEKIKSNQGNQDTKGTNLYNNGHKKMLTFYKVKSKDKKNSKTDYREYSEEKLSMSVEVPDMKISKKVPQKDMKDNMAYKVESEDQPIWRIDYMKHGMPSINRFGYEDDRLSGKLIKPGPNVMLDENRLEQSSVIRKEILHPDLYIKKNFARKGSVNFNSEGMD